jgi:hypothetical protein
VFFTECLRHSAKAILYSAKALPIVTLDKDYAECNTRQRIHDKYFIGKGFFAEYFFRTLSKDFAECRKALGKLRIDYTTTPLQKNRKTFFKIIGTTLQPYPITLSIALSFFTIILNQIYMFCEWLDSNSQPLSRAYPLIPLHYYNYYGYITFSFLMYYNKPRVI